MEDFGLAGKPDWKLRRDTHAKGFPENVRNWLRLDPVWSVHAEGVVGAMEAMLAGAEPSHPRFAEVRRVEPAQLDPEWTVDEPVVRSELDGRYEWLLLWRETDQFNVFSLYDDGTFERVFWDVELAGGPASFVIGVDKASMTTTKSLPPTHHEE